MSPFLSKSPNAKFNATSAGGMQLTAVDVCSPIARLLLNYYYYNLILMKPLVDIDATTITHILMLTDKLSIVTHCWLVVSNNEDRESAWT